MLTKNVDCLTTDLAGARIGSPEKWTSDQFRWVMIAWPWTEVSIQYQSQFIGLNSWLDLPQPLIH